MKVDTGMHRVGVAPEGAVALWAAVAGEPALSAEGLWTHLAVADGGSEGDREYTALQLRRFAEVAAAVTAAGPRPAVLHAANSAGAISFPSARHDLVRCGIALYGVAPSPAVAADLAAAGARAAAPGPVAALGGRGACAGSGPASAPPTAGSARCPSTRWWPRSPSATPTACPAPCSRRATRS